MAPEICLAVFIVVVSIADLFIPRKGWLAVISVFGLIVSAGLASTYWGDSPQSIFNNMLAVDNFAVFFKLLFIGIAILVILSAKQYVNQFQNFKGEFFSLVLAATLGMMLMAATTELISIFVSLELVNLSMYALIGLLKDARSSEAALKYLVLSAIASAILLLGMTLIFGFTGQTQLTEIAGAIGGMSLTEMLDNPALILGIVLIIGGLGYKIAMVPFHMWVPDVYEGAPTPITAFLSVGSKAAGFAVVLRIFYSVFGQASVINLDWGMIFAVLAAITMTVGNILAIQQNNIKRMLGYSSIAQAGYAMVGLAVSGASSTAMADGQSSLLFFLLSYSLANLGAFIAVIAITASIDSEQIADYGGIGKSMPWLGLALTLGMISLIGLPPAAGFMAKFYIFSSAIQHNLLWLIVVAIINSVISAYYYLRVVKTVWMEEPVPYVKTRASRPLIAALTLSCFGILFFGIFPGVGMSLTELARMLVP